MAFPQPGIFALGTRTHHHLQFDVPADTDGAELLAAVAEIRDEATTVAGVNVVVGFAPRLWAVLAPDEVVAGVADFAPITGPSGKRIPAEQHGMWLWLHGADASSIFDLAKFTLVRLQGLATLAADDHAFVYRASQDLTGFEDGTENPPMDEAIGLIGVPAGESGAGASVALVQRWVHDLAAFDALESADQQQIIGRTLDASQELPIDDRGNRAHISRVVIEDESGEEMEIFRRSAAYGGVTEHGLMFIGFAPDNRMQTMLERMVGVGDGEIDHLMDISTPMASAWYITPSVAQLNATREG